MAKKKTIKQTEQSKLVTCITCNKSVLLQWNKNPIIAHCKLSQEREVAACPRMCEHYELSKALPKPIKHMKSYNEVVQIDK